MMTALVPTHHSPGIARIGSALVRYAPPSVEVVGRPAPPRKDSRKTALLEGEEGAQLVILYCNGLRDHFQAIADRCLARGQRYVIVQIALRTTRHPNTNQWRDLWRKAALVWSYYPLHTWIHEDGGEPVDFNFYHSPLGVDAEIFIPPANGAHRSIMVCTSGARRSQESVAECDEAVAQCDGRIFQLGPRLEKMKSDVFYSAGVVSDEELARWYRDCQWVSGLRRHEGFELPAAEGLLCGARPLLYDRLHYRCWYDGLGDFIQEESRDRVVESLTALFSRGAYPVTALERAAAVERFNWATIIAGFWERCAA
jgi:hypothetical protein